MSVSWNEKRKRYQYRFRINLHGKIIRKSGYGIHNTIASTEGAEREHIMRLQHPERMPIVEPIEPEPGKSMTIRELAPAFLKQYEGSATEIDRRNLINGPIVRFFGSYMPRDVKQRVVDAFVSGIRRQARSTINNKLTALSQLLAYAVREELMEPHGLMLRAPAGKGSGSKAPAKIVAVAEADVDSLIEHASDPRIAVAIRLGCEAGLRIGEIRGVQWTDIRGDELTVRRSISSRRNMKRGPKNDKERTIVLSSALQLALKRLPRRGLPILTRDGRKGKPTDKPYTYKSLLTKIKAVYARAGVQLEDNISPWHSMRHAFATALGASCGGDVKTVMELMGHADITTTQRYLGTTSQRKRDAIRKAFG